MADSCTEYIYSNDYAEFTVNYNEELSTVYDRFSPECINRIARRYVVVYKKIDNIQELPIIQYGYNTFPKLYGLLNMNALEEIGVTNLRRIPNFDLTGRDVILGFVDTGINYTLDVFKTEDKKSRILSIWDQSIFEDEERAFVNYGRVYSKEEIDNAIDSKNPYEVVKQRDDVGHGTTMAAIAAGSVDIENNFSGVAPDSDIIVVKLKEAKEYLRQYYQIEEGAVCFQDNDIIAGIQYILQQGRVLNKPVVICLGVGTNSGSHEGRDNLSQFIDYFGEDAGVSIIVAGGNEVSSRHHYAGVMQIDDVNSRASNISNIRNYSSDIETIELNIGEGVNGFTMEVWIKNPNLASIGFRSPIGESSGVIQMRASRSDKIEFLFDKTIIYIDMIRLEENTGNALIFVRFLLPSNGIWNIDIYKDNKIEGRFDVWLPLKGLVSDDVTFVNSNPNTTLVSIANGAYSIAVSGYNGDTDGIYVNSSRGYTFDERIKPDLAAPAVNVYGPNKYGDYIYNSGTSIASSLTAGAVAMLFQWAASVI